MTLWFLYISVCLLYNLNKIVVRKKRPNYLVANIWRVFFGAVICIIENPFIDPGYPVTLLPAIPFAIWQGTSFYLIFDPLLNILRGLHPLYQGEDSGIFDSLPKPVYIGLKIICLIGFSYTTIILMR